jgi:hypothetical protein
LGRGPISILEAKTLRPKRTGKSGNSTTEKFHGDTLKQTIVSPFEEYLLLGYDAV